MGQWRGTMASTENVWGRRGKRLNGIKSIYVNSLVCVKVKRGERECFRIDRGARKACIMPPWFFNVYMYVVRREGKWGKGSGE